MFTSCLFLVQGLLEALTKIPLDPEDLAPLSLGVFVETRRS